MRALTIGLLSACLLASPAVARTLTMPTKADMQLLRSYLSASPPDFDALASRSDVASAATEFEKPDVVAREGERLRAAYLEIGEVDRIVLRLDSRLSRYDGAAGGFRLRSLEPDQYVAFGFEKLLFENSAEFAVWTLSPTNGRKMLEEIDSDRSVLLEIEAIPFATSATDGLALRAQIRTIRIASRDGVTLDEMRSGEPEAERILPGRTTAPTIPSNRLDLLGLKVGATYDEFRKWLTAKNFEGETIEEPLLKSWRYQLSFAAEPGVIPAPSDGPMPPRQDFWSPMPIVGEGFACDAKTPQLRICGSVTFSPEHALQDKKISSIRLAQTIGATGKTVTSSLTERFGSPSDSFAVELPTRNGFVEARQLVWGAALPRSDDTAGTVAMSDTDRAWQIEAVVVEVSAGRTVLNVQVSAPPAETSGAAAEARL